MSRAAIAIGIVAALVIVIAVGYWVRGPTSVLPAPSTAIAPRPGLPALADGTPMIVESRAHALAKRCQPRLCQ